MNTLPISMESLALPRELYWGGKMEPTSPYPVASELFALIEPTPTWIYEENFANGLTIINDEPEEEKQNIAQFISEDLAIELMDFKEEYLIDAKFHSLPPLNDYVNCVEVAQPNTVTKVHATNDQLHSLDATNYRNAVLAQLTPPQSPPQCSSGPSSVVSYQQSALQQQQLQSITVAAHVETKNLNNNQQTAAVYTNNTNNSNVNVAPTASNFQYNNAWQENDQVSTINNEIDEIVKIRAQELHNWHGDIDCEVEDDDDCVSQTSSSAYSSTPSQDESQTSCTDEDWLPGSGANSSYCSSLSNGSSSPLYNNTNNSKAEEQLSFDHQLATNASSSSSSSASSADSSSNSLNALKKRTRTYGRGIEDRKIRKKEQNKNAATRYRQKKKLEMEDVLSEEQVLAQRNDELKRTLADRKHETKYLRKLLREFYQGREI